jgi:S-adenosylmethionine:tRNA ribosyltransferase-isomerase
MHLSDLDYDLPPERIAQRAAEPRDASRLMAVRRDAPDAPAQHRRFRDIAGLLRPGDLLVVNDTRVLPARLFGVRPDTGGRVECLLVRERARGLWEAMLRPGRRMRPGVRLAFGAGALAAEVREVLPEGLRLLAFSPASGVHAAIARHGVMPLPPYIDRKSATSELHAEDRTRYQTVFAREEGAVAAPTAGLHFTDRLLDELAGLGVERATVTLHVGPGTFRPIATEDPTAHPMHSERYVCPEQTLAAIDRARARGGRVVACGTTTVRVLESVAAGAPREGETRLFIHPPFGFRAVDAMITNFHLPRSSLLLLVGAFLGDLERLKALYREALREGYRFYSYGDAMLVT